MAAITTAAIIAGVAGLASAAINAWQTHKTNQEQMDFSRESAAQSQQYAKDLMDYNSPAYQMGRIVSAGLNPNLAYENLDTPIPTGPQASQPNLRVPSFDTGIDDALKMAQLNRLNVASDNESAETDAKVKLLYKDLGLKDAEIDLLHNHAKALAQSIDESKSRISLMSQQERSFLLDNLFKDATMQDRYRTIAAERQISEKQAEYQEKYIAAKILNLDEQAKYYKAQANLSYKQMRIVDELVNVYKEQSRGLNIENDINNMTLRGMQVPYGSSGIESGVFGSYFEQQKKISQSAIIELQRQLVQKYGATKEVVAIIESLSRSLENVSNAASNWVSDKEKTVEYGNVKKRKRGKFVKP